MHAHQLAAFRLPQIEPAARPVCRRDAALAFAQTTGMKGSFNRGTFIAALRAYLALRDRFYPKDHTQVDERQCFAIARQYAERRREGSR